MKRIEKEKKGMDEEHILDPQEPCHAPPEAGMIDISHLRLVHGSNYGTSGYGVNNAPDQVPANSLHEISLWLSDVNNPEVDSQTLLPRGVELLKQNFADLNSIKHLFGRYEAVRDIQIGNLLNGTKKITKKLTLKWGPWSEENLPFIGKRTRERMMRLARRTDVHHLPILGVDRLDVLCAATEDLINNDPHAVRNFMARHGIQFDPTQEFDLDEFKRRVDAAINMDRLQKASLTVDRQLVYNLTVSGINVDKSLLRKLKDVQESGGDIAVSLNKLSINRGQISPDDEGEKRLADFNTLSNRLIKTIDYLVAGESDDIDRIDAETFVRLLKKLQLLQKVAHIIEEDRKAA